MVIGDPDKVLNKWDARYDSKSTASRISTMSELVSITYPSLRQNIYKYVDFITELAEQLCSIGTKLDISLSI